MKMINWNQYGLRKNPYSTDPLLEGDDITFEKAFVGRVKERKILDDFFASQDGGAIVIGGNVGVGKTSLMNFEKFIWKECVKEHKLFSFRREIEADHKLLDKRVFIIEIIGSVLREIELIDNQLIHKNEVLFKLKKFVDYAQIFYQNTSSQIGGNLGFISGSVSSSEEKDETFPIQLTVAFLEKSLDELMRCICTEKINNNAYRGLIVHVNNFDVLLEEKENHKRVKGFFQEIRDLMQTKNIFFVFIGPLTFFSHIIRPLERVRPIFLQYPVIIQPLSKEEIIYTLRERMELLQSTNVTKTIPPIADEVVYHLYDIYQGDIRSIFSAIEDILGQVSNTYATTLTLEESMIRLGAERLDRISTVFTQEQIKVLLYISDFDAPFTVTQLTEKLNKNQTNISGYYLSPLKQHDVIYLVEEKGREKYWDVTNEFMPIREARKMELQRRQKISQDSIQDSLFRLD